jgi:outer membrane protein assembly factor BamB
MTTRATGALLTILTISAVGTPVSVRSQTGDTPWPTYQHDNQHTGRSMFAIEGLGRLEWQFVTGDDITHGPALGADGTIYFGSNDHYLYAVNPDGSQRWTFVTGGAISTTPTIGTDGAIYVVSQDDHLYALEPDGSLRWQFQLAGAL